MNNTFWLYRSRELVLAIRSEISQIYGIEQLRAIKEGIKTAALLNYSGFQLGAIHKKIMEPQPVAARSR
ncbi:hypothetical protein [Scytonema sp. NUACC26]|uniref:hypothetical protein n=1 Tax=Scytonema sp. NUACC26 TaxID=3140176 RepID=UPI0038B2AB6C